MGYGTIKTLTELGNMVFVRFTKTVTITGGSAASPVNTTFTGTVSVPSGTTFLTMLGPKLGTNPLPYYTDNMQGITVVREVTISSAASNNLSVTVRSSTGAWTNYTFSCILVFRKS